MILGLGHNENDFKNQIYGNKKTFIIVENGDFAKFARGLIGANGQRWRFWGWIPKIQKQR